MAYWKTILTGSMASTERWTVSNSWGIVGLAPDTPDQARADDILSRLLTYTTSVNVPGQLLVGMSTALNITGWRVELRGEDERILSIAEGVKPTPVGGLQTPSKTPQDCIVISLRTSTPGARGRGRMYWPGVGATLSNQFQLTQPLPADMAADAKIWLNAIGTQMNNSYIAAASALRVALAVRSPTDHVCRDVKQIQVGSVLDTQRRRRDALKETYSTVAYP